jgi:hypothetical protein
LKIAIPNKRGTVQGLLRDLTKYRKDSWELKITTELSNTENLYLEFSDSDIAAIKEAILRDENKFCSSNDSQRTAEVSQRKK